MLLESVMGGFSIISVKSMEESKRVTKSGRLGFFSIILYRANQS